MQELLSLHTELQESSMITGIAGKKGFSVITMTKNGMSSELGVIRRVPGKHPDAR